jgi:hypothetical protein
MFRDARLSALGGDLSAKGRIRLRRKPRLHLPRCGGKLWHTLALLDNFIGMLGIEPSLRAPEARVLPVYYIPFFIFQREPKYFYRNFSEFPINLLF